MGGGGEYKTVYQSQEKKLSIGGMKKLWSLPIGRGKKHEYLGLFAAKNSQNVPICHSKILQNSQAFRGIDRRFKMQLFFQKMAKFFTQVLLLWQCSLK